MKLKSEQNWLVALVFKFIPLSHNESILLKREVKAMLETGNKIIVKLRTKANYQLTHGSST